MVNLNDIDIQKELVTQSAYTSWQFIEYARKNMEIADYCAATINRIVQKLSIKTIRWEQDLFSGLIDTDIDGKSVKKVTVTEENMPEYEMRVIGEKVDPWFLFDKLIRDFYQYVMNAFDSMSQIANSGLLGKYGKKVDKTDFQIMQKTFGQATYKPMFPLTSAWFTNTFNSPEFKYIEAINNRTKHTADVGNKLSMGILGGSNVTKIGAFFRNDEQHQTKDLSNQMQATLDFLYNSWDDFMMVFLQELQMKKCIDGRRHFISGVYQQKYANEQNLVYAYINVEGKFETMPKEIYIALVREYEDEVKATNCPFDHILVRGSTELEILGRYNATEEVGDDCLLRYRKYVKDENVVGGVCIAHEAIQKDVTFYHWNPFFDITTISDDAEFRRRVQMPI